ncbi:class I SAM-dependent methyltransferase [bacterium]|nr:class I SAM-dependent methyltransferase [bacterium]
MEYDRIKDVIAQPMRTMPWFRRLSYKLFELAFLRVRYVKRELVRQLGHRRGRLHILDAGFGFGPYIDFLLRRFPLISITGIEIKDEQVADCRRFFDHEGFGDRLSLDIGDLLEYRKDDTYDVAIAVDIMEHIVDDVHVMRNLHASLKSGGMLLIHTPASAVDSRTVEQEDFFVGEHVREGYLKSELDDKLREAGFDDVALHFSYGKHGLLAWWIMQGIPLRLVHKFAPFAILLPIYYLFTFPFAHRLMTADMAVEQTWGKGLLAIAKKK